MSADTIKDIARQAAHQAESIAKHLFPTGKREGHEWCVGSVAGEAGRSLKIHLTGNKAGVWQDFANPEDTGDLVELWARARCNGDKGKALREIRAYLGIREFDGPSPLKSAAGVAAKIRAEYHQLLKANLANNTKATAYLTGPTRGLDSETIRYFGLGLSEPYTGSDGVTRKDAVVAPMRSPETGAFLKKMAYICVPEVTQNPLDRNGWMKGEPQTYFADVKRKQRFLFVCEGLKDVWRHWQALRKAESIDEFMLISSTHGGAFPAEWKSEAFWSGWEAVYLGQDNDEAGKKIVERLLDFIGREARRVEVPEEFGKDWTDFWQHGGDAEVFRALVDQAPVASGAAVVVSAPAPDSNAPRIGRFSFNLIDINGAYVNGFLYYPTETHIVKRDDDTGSIVERLETVVIRSDRTIHRAVYAPAPPGTPLNKRVLKLTDNTVIEKEPHASSVRTWDYESIDRYIKAKTSTRPLGAILTDVLAALQQAVWLPYEEDYVVLALAVPVTYVQSVFESVPLLLLNGPAGTGKSQTGNTMARLCANGTVIGQVSAASQ